MVRRAICSPALALCLVALPASRSAAAPQSSPLDGEHTAALFAQLKQLAGSWRSASSRGWTGGMEIRVIAAGSAVMILSHFDDDPGQGHGMATMITLDGEQLLLTHYCEAGNQPRLRASALSADGRTVTFTFLDGGNLRDRDQGHMDQAVLELVDADHLSERWTWYAQGKERWLEKIDLVRTATATAAPQGAPAPRRRWR